jgi:hypothetical protein
VASHAGSWLLTDVAVWTPLTGELSEVLAGLCKPRTRHDPASRSSVVVLAICRVGNRQSARGVRPVIMTGGP